jgi:hypothetical protein
VYRGRKTLKKPGDQEKSYIRCEREKVEKIMATDKMTEEKLKEKHPLYSDYIDEWDLYDVVFRSGKPLIEYAIYRHPRESEKNYNARLQDGYVFNFGKTIIDIFHFYLTEKDVVRDLKGLANDPQWEMFVKDADLSGTNYDVLLDEAQKFASVGGSIGILVNKPASRRTVGQEIKNGIYPYYALYSLTNIYDWTFQKNPITHRRELVYLKLYEGDGLYTLWYPNRWEQWLIGKKYSKPELVDEDFNVLGEIPFLWMNNVKDLMHPEIGVSDLVDVSRIVTSMTQNLSCGEETIKLAGFPIMRIPKVREGEEEDEFAIGPRATSEFDPDVKDGKADWMPTEILEPIEAMLKWIEKKADEIYRIAHLSGIHGQRKSDTSGVASGLALRYEFSQLNSVLLAKSANQTEAELAALRLWLKWQGKEKLFKDMEVKRSSEFSIDEMSVALDNAITAMNRVMSKTFRNRVQEKIVKHTLPDLSQMDKELIQKEIEANTPEPKPEDWMGDTKKGSSSVRSALEARADHSLDGQVPN